MMRQAPTLNDFDLSDPDVYRKLDIVRTKGDLQYFVSAKFSMSKEPSLIRKTKP